MSEYNRSSLDIYYPDSTYSNYVIKDFNNNCDGICNYDNIGMERPSYLQIPNTEDDNVFNKYIWNENDNNSLLYLTVDNSSINGYLKFNNDRVYPIIGNINNSNNADIIIKYPKEGIMDQGKLKLKKINNNKYRLYMSLSKYSNLVFYNADQKSNHQNNSNSVENNIMNAQKYNNVLLNFNIKIDSKVWNLCFDKSFIKDSQVFLTCKKSNRILNKRSRNCPYKINRKFPTNWIITEYNQPNQYLIHSYSEDINNIPRFYLECNENGGVNVSEVYGSEKQIWQFIESNNEIYIQSVYFGWYLNYTNEPTILNNTLTVRMSNTPINWNIQESSSGGGTRGGGTSGGGTSGGSTSGGGTSGGGTSGGGTSGGGTSGGGSIINYNDINGLYIYKNSTETEYEMNNLIDVKINNNGGTIEVPIIDSKNKNKIFNVKFVDKSTLEGQSNKFKITFKILGSKIGEMRADIYLTDLQNNKKITLSGNKYTDNSILRKYSAKVIGIEGYTNSSNQTLKSCPSTHPYAYGTSTYGEGPYCCIGNPGRKGENDKFDCATYGCGDGCGNFTVKCDNNGGSCHNNLEVISSIPNCPASHPYPYNGGLYESNGDKENTYGYIESIKATHDKKNYFCCSTAISQDSTVCDDWAACPEPPCYEKTKTKTSLKDLKNLTDIQVIKYVNLDNGIWKIYTAQNSVSGINLPPKGDEVNYFINTSRYLTKVKQIGFSFEEPNTDKFIQSQITGVEIVKPSSNLKSSPYSNLYKVYTVYNPGGILIRKPKNISSFPINVLGMLYIQPLDTDYSPCFSLDQSIKAINVNYNCYVEPNQRDPINVRIDGQKTPQTIDNINLIHNYCDDNNGCFNSSNKNNNVPWCFKRGELCKANQNLNGNYICSVDPIVYSWNNMEWNERNPCGSKGSRGYIYKNSKGINICKDNESVNLLSNIHLNDVVSQYGKINIKSDGNYQINDNISVTGGMKISANRYIYALINNIIYRYDVLANIDYNIWEALPNNSDYKMHYITLDNTKRYLYGIPYGTDQTKIFKYDILKSQWSKHNLKIKNTQANFTKILFTVDNNEMILLDSRGNIYYKNKIIFTSNNKLIIYNILLDNTGKYLFVLTNIETDTSLVLHKVLLTKQIGNISNSKSIINLDKGAQFYVDQTFMNKSSNDTNDMYSIWNCNPLCTNSIVQQQNNFEFGFEYAIKACNDKDSCQGFYQDGTKYYLATSEGLPPTKSTNNSIFSAKKVYIKKNNQNFSTNSLLLSYNGSKVYFINHKYELMYIDLRTCKVSRSLLPNINLISITLGPDRELYGTSKEGILYKINTENTNVLVYSYTANVIFKSKLNQKSPILLCHFRPTMFIKYQKNIYYLDKESKILNPIMSNTSTIISNYSSSTTNDAKLITPNINISTPKCLLYYSTIKNNYLPISKGPKYNLKNLLIPDCNLYKGCNCESSNETKYYKKIPGQPSVFSMNKKVGNITYEDNPYLNKLTGNFTYCPYDIKGETCNNNNCTIIKNNLKYDICMSKNQSSNN